MSVFLSLYVHDNFFFLIASGMVYNASYNIWQIKARLPTETLRGASAPGQDGKALWLSTAILPGFIYVVLGPHTHMLCAVARAPRCQRSELWGYIIAWPPLKEKKKSEYEIWTRCSVRHHLSGNWQSFSQNAACRDGMKRAGCTRGHGKYSPEHIKGIPDWRMKLHFSFRYFERICMGR